ncbi:DUF4249 domain-containing protein [Flavobacterium jejuense]|uniref:DUF4249 domain-containing protein n=1 Tax=Flavobacterium jejuense TaxID=1544455 RepID=A0ABX0INZ2_9FLAO|nr:DUF4249 family protein [Flavobacterium jejuense]NHN25278.1 DUF4249 domain-containing protein [Flavobacterium jejuense]
MKTLIKIIIGLTGLFLTGCEEVVQVDLETGAPKLVIDASIDWVKGTMGNEQKIKLSTSTGYYSSSFPTVSGASITVENSSSVIFDFIETPGTGEYICDNFQPVIGETYTLTILLNGQVYTASENLISVPNIEDNVIQNNDAGFGGDEVEVLAKFQDNGSEENYYLYRHKSNRVAFPQYQVENDQNVQGNQITMYYSNKDLVAGDPLNIKLYGISRRYYEYFKKILLASGNDDSPFPSTPAAVRGNIVNQTNFNNFAFGYFRLSEVDVKDYVIQ